jgi:hypothetical protein
MAQAALAFTTRQKKKKPCKTLVLQGFVLVGDTWIEHVTPAV